jgi:hypothetical protein
MLIILSPQSQIFIRMEEKRHRRALTDADRLLIRKRNQTHPPAQQKDLANWFTATTGHPIDEFLNPEDETIFDEDEDIFTSVVNHYAVARPSEEEESSDEEGDEVKEVDNVEALRAVETMKMWKLQKGNSQDLQAFNLLAGEIAKYRISIAQQTTIHSVARQNGRGTQTRRVFLYITPFLVLYFNPYSLLTRTPASPTFCTSTACC